MIQELEDAGLSYDRLDEKQKLYFRTFIWNGVGSREFIDPPEAIFHKCSLYHDFYYWRGGPDKYRIMADHDFFHRCHDQARKQPWYNKAIYFPLSYVYFLALKILGHAAWEYRNAPCQTWDELLRQVYKYYYDGKPNIKNRPPTYEDWLSDN